MENREKLDRLVEAVCGPRGIQETLKEMNQHLRELNGRTAELKIRVTSLEQTRRAIVWFLGMVAAASGAIASLFWRR